MPHTSNFATRFSLGPLRQMESQKRYQWPCRINRNNSMRQCPWRALSPFLVALVLFQWILLSIVMSRRYDPLFRVPTVSSNFVAPVNCADASKLHHAKLSSGVAITLMLKAPKWFARRYTIMVHNVLANIPDNWRVQVFVNTAWLEKDVLPLHPGLNRMFGYGPLPTESWTIGRVTWTPMPVEFITMRPKEILKSKWLWTSVLEENVLMFGGNGAFCANGGARVEHFISYDYVGAPWNRQNGQGGDGSTHSFRHRSAMISILEKYPPLDDSLDYLYFLKHLLQDNYKVADREMTHFFGGFQEWEKAPFVISGTQAAMNYTMRDNLLSVCPEIKMIFPSMHEPACFGAHPDGLKCKESICALQEVLPPQGC